MSKLTVRKSQCPAAEDLVQVLVNLEPPWQCSEKEQEDCKAKESCGSENTGCIPDLSGER